MNRQSAPEQDGRDDPLLYIGSAPFLEALYLDFLRQPESVDPQWRSYFEQLPLPPDGFVLPQPATEPSPGEGVSPPAMPPQPEPAPTLTPGDPCVLSTTAAARQGAVLRLINAYRTRGHQVADIEPLHLRERPAVEDLDPSFHGLGEAEMEESFDTGSLFAPSRLTLREIIDLLQQVYCGSIGAEYMHITDTRHKRWIQQRLEAAPQPPSPQLQLRLLERIAAAEGLERYLHSRYVGQKRFSLEGGEVVIAILDQLVQSAGGAGVKEIILGMAHRGRLNVLINILGKAPADLFLEFEGRAESRGTGDVKYHMGFSSSVATPGGVVHLVLAFNPSHLEIVSPVVEGSVRARQQRRGDRMGDQVLPILIHGDSAFAGQGVVMETLQMSQARGYATGGTLHLVINNQVGFTTSNPLDMRSSLYCTDVAKMVQAPIFHVNGDDPEAVWRVVAIALDYRNHFHRDVVVDIVCYRRHGHNEADEPAVTQPMMYRRIREHPTLLKHYAARLKGQGVVSDEIHEELVDGYRQRLDRGEVVARGVSETGESAFLVDWKPYQGTPWDQPATTAVSLAHLQQVAERMLKMPSGFELHPRVAKIFEDRSRMAAGALAIDWGFAELSAYATLLMEGYEVRLSGQDSGRGTFFHRHAVIHNRLDGSSYVPLQHLAPGQPHFVVIDSLLSEEAVLGYEFGYATAEPRALVLWEAQFGDFANGAQVVIDQFISSGEAKWGRLSGLVMLLPHGYEGQGPEHSSARLERYMQLCAEENIQVCVPSTPAQFFHMLRRQMVRPFRKPLIVMTPKSLLRNPLSTSPLEALYSGGFECVIDEIDEVKPAVVKRVVLCSGKVYFDLLQQRRERELSRVALVRIEQLYPFPERELKAVLRRYSQASEVVWCQEEPKNQGAWYQIQHALQGAIRSGQRLSFAGRPAAAAPAVGHFPLHVRQQLALIETALT